MTGYFNKYGDKRDARKQPWDMASATTYLFRQKLCALEETRRQDRAEALRSSARPIEKTCFTERAVLDSRPALPDSSVMRCDVCVSFVCLFVLFVFVRVL